MFPDLNNFLDIDVDRLPRSQCILVSETAGSNGAFVLADILSLALRGNSSVCFVGLAQSFHHYRCVADKMALNLTRFRESGKLAFVEALDYIGNGFIENAKASMLGSSADAPRDNTNCGKGLLKKLFFTIKESINKLPSDLQLILILDDLSILTSVGCREIDVSVFFRYLRMQVCVCGGTIASLVHHMEDNIADKYSMVLHRHIGHQSDVIISVRRLRTGYCHEVHGEISVWWKPAGDGKLERSPRAMHFKVGDKTVSLFPPGMSTVVL
jgi:hypothetical protein